MTDKRPFKAFNQVARKPVERTKDNAAPRIKPPSIVTMPPPDLAPPGMAGVRPKRFALAQAPQAPKREFSPGDSGNLKRTFKPLAQATGKDHGPER